MLRRDAMRISLAFGAVFSIAAILPVQAAEPQISGPMAKVGEQAPDFRATDMNGKSVALSDFKGKVVVLEWTNHECPFVRKHYNSGNMQALQKQATDAGVVWLTLLSSDKGEQGFVTPEQARQLTAERKASPSYKLFDTDGKIGHLYGAQVTPHMYVIDPSGKLAYIGAIDDKPSTRLADVQTARNYVREALAAVKDGKAMEPPLTRAYGCTIKYAS